MRKGLDVTTLFHVILAFRAQLVNAHDLTTPDSYLVTVQQAPGRGWGGPLQTVGLDAAQIRTVRAAYRGFVARQQARGDTTGGDIAPPIRQLGAAMFLVLPETIQARLQQSQAYASDHNGRLHISLNFEPSAFALLDLPWELLCDPVSHFFYGLRGGGVSRCMLLPTAPTDNKAIVPEEILGCWAEPQGVASLVERQRYAPAPGKQNGMVWLQGPGSIRQLQQALATDSYAGLHLVAHGRVGSPWDFAIALEDENGRSQWLSLEQLTVLLSHYPSVRFVYLDICATGDNLAHHAQETDAASPEVIPGGAAGQLMGIGVSTLIIMQDRISQTAAGQMADCFYRELAQGSSPELALTVARRTVQLQQGDAIHWSVPALYTQKPLQKAASPIADWLLDELFTPVVLGSLIAVFLLVILIGSLSFQLAQVALTQPLTWLRLPLLLTACGFIPILTAAATAQGQAQLAEKYGYNGRSWFPFLWHKYFSAFVWTMMAWFFVWLVWLGIYGAGLRPGAGMRQLVWAGSLALVALAAHVGVRQAVRQDLLFKRVGFSLFRGGWLDVVMIVVLLLIGPFLFLLLFWGVWLIWTTIGGNGATGWGLIWLVLLVLGGAFLNVKGHS